MQSRLWINLSLLALAVVLGLVIFSDAVDQKDEKLALSPMDPASIKRIEIQRQGQTSLLLEKSNGKWMVTIPRKSPAEQRRVDALLKIPHSRSFTQYPVVQEELSKFSLDPPKVTLILNNESFHFGDVDPLQFKRYALVGQTLHLVENTFYHHLIAVPDQYAETKQKVMGAEPDPQQ